MTFPFGEIVVEVRVHCDSLPTTDFVPVSETVLFPTVDGAGEGSEYVPAAITLPASCVTTQFAAWSRPDSPPLNAGPPAARGPSWSRST